MPSSQPAGEILRKGELLAMTIIMSSNLWENVVSIGSIQTMTQVSVQCS